MHPAPAIITIMKRPCLLISAILLCSAAAHAQGFEKKAAALARLRAEVEQLESKLQGQRTSAAAEIKALAAQKAELDLMIRKEKIRVAALRSERQRQLARLRVESAKASRLVPTLLQSVKGVEALVKTGLPFKIDERLEDLDKIRRGLIQRTLTPQTATSQLWQFIEDELELCRDSGLFRQPIELGGKRMLADVVRLGMVALLFRTKSGEVGHARREKGGDYRFVSVPPGPVQDGIIELFNSLKKQIRSGIFRIPVPPIQRTRGGS